MKIMRALLTAVCLSLLLFSRALSAAEPSAPTNSPIRVLLMTGGHKFETEPFFKLFKDNPEITYQAVEPPQGYEQLRPEHAAAYDVLVLYTYNRSISEQAKSDLVNWLASGKGLVVLHHAIATYPDWPEYWKILGARYYLKSNVVDGVFKPRSAFKEGMHFKIHVAAPNHPVTRGVQDFEIHDETYKLFDVYDECHPLLTTDEPRSNPVIAWAKTYKKARVVYLQSGHDHFAYENPNYQQILRQALRWTANRN